MSGPLFDQYNDDAPARPAFSSSPDDQLQLIEEEFIAHSSGLAFLVFGKRLYGVVDQVPGLFYVATFFYHLFWIPIVPIESWIILVDSHGFSQARTRPIGFSARSILVAWARSVCIVVGILGGCAVLGAMILALHDEIDVSAFLLALLSATGAIVVFVVIGRIERASPERTQQLAVQAGFPPGAIREILGVNCDRASELPSQDVGLVPCPSCGRQLSRSTRVCPRCEHRMG